MNFSHVAQVFDKIEKITGRTATTQELAQLFSQASAHETEIICNLSLGQLNPAYKSKQFNIAQKTILKVMVSLTGQTAETIAKHYKEMGDLGLLAAHYISHPDKNLTVTQVYDALSQLQEISGTGAHEQKELGIKELLLNVDALSAKYIVRILMDQLRLGFSDMTILDALSWMITGDKSLKSRLEHAYNICADIGYIARLVRAQGIQAIDDIHIQLGIPIRPAAAERLPTAQAVFEKLGPCVAQQKLDGFRIQIHIDKTKENDCKFMFFSRNLLDMSLLFPDLAVAVCQLPVKQLIAEGEAITYDTHTHQFLSFQETVKRKRKYDIEQMAHELPLQLFFFDLLYVDGHSWLDKTHEQRRAKLVEIIGRSKGPLSVVQERAIGSVDELQTYLQESVQAGLEGLVVKRPNAHYQPGKRNFNWIKLKRSHIGHLEDTIDVVILGYYYGEGKRASFGIGAFLVGVYNKNIDGFQTIAKIGTGLSDADWKDLKNRADSLHVDHQPRDVQCPKELFPDVWIKPELVCIVQADEITQSPLHTAGKTNQHNGFALRFPRFIAYRDDKTAYQVTTVSEISRLYEDQFKR